MISLLIAIGVAAVVLGLVVGGLALNRLLPDDGLDMVAPTGPTPSVQDLGSLTDDEWIEQASTAAGLITDAYWAIAFYAGQGDADGMSLECSRIANSFRVRNAASVLQSAPNPEFSVAAAEWADVFFNGMRACAERDFDTALASFRAAGPLLLDLEILIAERQVV